MRLTWKSIRDHYRAACSSATQAIAEEYIHINAALQWLTDQVECHELYGDTRKSCFTGRDYVELPTDCYSVYSVWNQTEKVKLDPEPAGMRGRTRYLGDNGIPSSGSPRWYALQSSRLYLRDTPDAADVLVIQYKKQPVAIAEADLAATPIVPDQYHWSLVWYAAGNYHSLHPDMDVPEGQQPRALMLHQKAMAALQAPPEQKEKEDLDRREYTRLAGYSFSVRGR